ncbi:acyltransferase family protein [Glycomyces tenuis]|uniref:acyltransferase family protein n=2 Tax=Glycomyces tenuis TaxID=58116 RepID=UPI00047E6B8B|nr:acyltransferase family protein [Glycomyces tenuis]
MVDLRDEYRPEIQGLRAFAVLLVAVYHIWFGRVSGGVDVFLMLTGFFITGSLVRSYEKHGRLMPVVFLTRLSRRLVPTAAVVLLGIAVIAWLWMPWYRTHAVMSETLASALYYENWILAARTVDYLNRSDPVSPLQHFWSLSIQGQFYLVWIALMALVALVVKVVGGHLRKVAFAACALVLAVSLPYSIAATAENQTWAYFSTGTRMWEFALGGMLAMALPMIRIPVWIRFALGWIGVLSLIACGALFNVSDQFPGYIALWPVGAAILVILAGTTGKRWAVDRFLASGPMTALGDRSYALYLWHWPILVVYLYLNAERSASILGGLAVLALSLGAAFLTKWAVEDRVLPTRRRRFSRGKSVAVAAAFLVPVLGVASVAQAQLVERTERLDGKIDQALESGDVYLGAEALTDPELFAQLEDDDMPMIPPLAEIKDIPYYYDEGCDNQTRRVCAYGDLGGEHTIALVGASRIGHWFPAFEQAALDNGWRLLVFTKSSCQFSTGVLYDPGGEVYPECMEWNRWVMDQLELLRPDLAVTLSTRALEDGEQTYTGFVNRWHQLDHWGIDVLALRDLPRIGHYPEDCIGLHGVDACADEAAPSQAETDPALALANVPDNVHLADLTEYVCPEGTCPAAIGNILTYRDKSHITATYSATLAPFVEQTVLEATGW